MDEFLDKLQEDQRRMRRFLRAQGARFKQMGEALAAARQLRSRIFVVGEPPLDALAALVAEDYLTHLPALAVDLTRPAPPSVNPDESAEALVGRAAAAKQAARHLHAGDVVLALLVDGADRETRMLLESARAKRVTTLVIGGLEAKGAVRRLATARISLPTQGVKTICEQAFVCARILARVSRAAAREGGEAEDERLVLVTCETCNERIFHLEKDRGRQAACPLCQGSMRVPADAGRRAVVAAAPPRGDGPRKRRLKPSVLALPAAQLADDASADDDEAAASGEAPAAPPRATRSSREGEAVRRGDAAGSSREGRVRTGSRSRPQEPSDAGAVEAAASKAEASKAEASKSKARSRPAMPAVDDVDDLVIDDEADAPPPPAAGPPAAPPRSATPRPHEAPVGLVSHDQPRPSGRIEPNFGSDILVGSDVVSAEPRPPVAATHSALDPYAADEAFLADLEAPSRDAGSASGRTSSAGSADEASRRLSSRFTVAECRVRWGRGGFPDEGSPPHELLALTPARVELLLDPDDEAGSTLQKGDELWLRVEIPAFIEPVLVRGMLTAIRGTAGDGRRGSRVDLELREVDPAVRRKLARAAESMGAPA